MSTLGIASVELTSRAMTALEQMLFVLAEPVEDDPEELLPRCTHHVAVTFESGEMFGILHLSADETFLIGLASSMLGVEESEVRVEPHGVGALLEFANVLGGQVVLLLGGRHVEFRLTLPTPVAAEIVANADKSDRERVYAGLHDHKGVLRIAVSLR